MNPFEKIFNYQVLSRLDENDALALTTQERAWLKTMLALPSAAEAFAPETLAKLNDLLLPETETAIRDIIVEKARSRERHLYHPMLRALRRIITVGSGIRLTFRLKDGSVKAGQTGVPYKLEYSMVKREWYLLWYSLRGRSLMSTKLANLVAAEAADLPPERIAELKEALLRQLDKRREQAVVQVMPAYNAELSRILYAFSCFDKTVGYDEEAGLYTIRLHFLADESEFLLSKIRFLGLRVKVVEGEQLRRRMRESSSMALARYGESPQREAESPAAD